MSSRSHNRVIDAVTARAFATDLVEALHAAASCEGAAIYWLDATVRTLVEIAAAGTSEDQRRAVVHPGQGVVGRALFCDDLIVDRENGLDVVAAPIRLGGVTVGVVAARFTPQRVAQIQEKVVARSAASASSPRFAVLQIVAEERLAAEKYDSLAALVGSRATDARLLKSPDTIETVLARVLGTDYAAIAYREPQESIAQLRKRKENAPNRPVRQITGSFVVPSGAMTDDVRNRVAATRGLAELRRDGDTVLVVPIVTAAGHVADIVAGWHFGLDLDDRALSFAETLAEHAAMAFAALPQRDDRTAALPQAASSRQNGASAVSALRSAIALNHLELEYQPIFDLGTGKIVQCEALCRWPSGPKALASPDRFIRLAEDHGLIDSLTERVVIMALRDWQKMPADIRLAINVSTLNLLDPRFCTTLLKLLCVLSFPPERLSIELTETALLPGAQRQDAIRMAAELSQSGILISIDDFGEGHASFGYLKMFEATSIKIDRGFITQIGDNSLDLAIVKSIIELAHNLKVSVTAEGIEDAATLDVMRGLGCDLVQGFGCARPMTSSLLRRYVERGALLGAQAEFEPTSIAI